MASKKGFVYFDIYKMPKIGLLHPKYSFWRPLFQKYSTYEKTERFLVFLWRGRRIVQTGCPHFITERVPLIFNCQYYAGNGARAGRTTDQPSVDTLILKSLVSSLDFSSIIFLQLVHTKSYKHFLSNWLVLCSCWVNGILILISFCQVGWYCGL